MGHPRNPKITSQPAVISPLLGDSAEAVSAEWLMYHPAVRANRGSSRGVNHPAIICLRRTSNFRYNRMQIRLESSKVATDVMDAEVQLETRAVAAQRLEKCWLNICVKWESLGRRETL